MSECQLIPFPLVARVAKVRRVAEVYGRKTGNDRAAYWKIQSRFLWDSLTALGFSEGCIAKEMEEFRGAVQAELRRLNVANQQGENPKGAA